MFSFLRSKKRLISRLSCVPYHTPDAGLLRMRVGHLLFHYGQHIDVPRVSDAYTVERMSLWDRKPNGDSIAAIAMNLAEVPRAHVYGGLHFLSTDQVEMLDIFWQNGVLFRRKRVPVFVAFPNQPFHRLEVWMYVGNPDFWQREMDWDLSYFRGYGDYRLAEVTEANGTVGRHYRHRPIAYPFKVSPAPHYRKPDVHEMVCERDKQEQEAYEKATAVAKEIANATYELTLARLLNEQSNRGKATVS